MKHKWHKEIKAWADGAEIEHRWVGKELECIDWYDVGYGVNWDCDVSEFRIKLQPKEPQYLYVWNVFGKIELTQHKNGIVIDTWNPSVPPKYIGKIKIEVDK